MKAYQNKKIAFWGTTHFSAQILRELHKEYKDITVIAPPDRKSNRGQKITRPPTKKTAQSLSLQVLQPEKIDDNFFDQFKEHNFDISIVVAYGAIIPKNFIENPRHKTINIHTSLLPKYRGASPVQTSIIKGEKETGVTLMKIDEKMDHGPIIAQQNLKIENKDTTESLFDKMIPLSTSLLKENLPLIFENKHQETPQDHTLATYTKIIKKEDGLINWDTPALAIEKQVRALSENPGMFSFLNNKRMKIIECKAINTDQEQTTQPGTIVLHQEDNKKEMGVTTQKGVLIIKTLHPENKNSLPGEIFISTQKQYIGQKFS